MAIHKDLTGETAIHVFSYKGSSDPGAVGAGKGWIDTTTGPPYQLKVRNSGNTAWETVGTTSGAVSATETTAGIAEIATQTETNTGTDDARIVTPLKQKTFGDANYATKAGMFDSPTFVSANTTASATERAYIVDATTGAKTITLPTASGRAGKEYFVKKADSSANTVTIDPNSSETVNGASSLVLTAQNDGAIVESDGSNWFVTARSSTTGGGAGALDDLSDVVVSSPAVDHGIFHNGTTFVNKLHNARFSAGVSVSSNGTVGADTHSEIVNASGGAVTRTLPTAVGIAGKRYTIKKIDTSSNLVVVQTTSSQTIDGFAPPWNIRYQNEAITYESDGANWFIAHQIVYSNLDDIRDVDLTGRTTDDLLTYDGTNWVPVDRTTVVTDGGGGGGSGFAVEEDGSEEGTGIDRLDFTTGLNVSVSGTQATISADAFVGRTLLTVASDVTNSTSTYSDVTGLTFSVSSGTAYRFYALILYDSQATSTGAGFAVNGPATPTRLNYRVDFSNGSSQNYTSFDASNTQSSVPVTDGNLAIIQGIVIPSASGTFAVRFRSEAPGTNNQITVKAGSTLERW